MKISIIGPEGAGKTVLAAVLSDFVQRHPNLGLRLRARGHETKQYCSRVMEVLKNAEWPDSTRKGKIERLEWQWGIDDAWHNADLLDPAGQDIREELAGNSTRLGLKAMLIDSNLVLLTIDAASHQGARAEVRVQNAWIIEHVLQLFDPLRQNLLIVLTKADLVSHELEQGSWGNREAVLNTLAHLMPECDFRSYREQLMSANCSAVAVAAVEAQDHVVDGRHVRIPRTPLSHPGLAQLVSEVVRAARAIETRRAESSRHKPQPATDSVRRTVGLLGLTIVLSLLIASLYFQFTADGRDTKIDVPRVFMERITLPCDKCDGDGKLEATGWSLWLWPAERCPKCDGTGEVTVTRQVG